MVWSELHYLRDPETKTLPATTGSGKTLANSCRNSWEQESPDITAAASVSCWLWSDWLGLCFTAWWLVAPTKQQRPASRTAGAALSNYTAAFIT